MPELWKWDHIRLFISHRDSHKDAAHRLDKALEGFGISSFVAHDTIEPIANWREEILKALKTMDALLAFVTNDFGGSDWTNQEVGFALGRDIPVIPIKVQDSDPAGFLSSLQAVRANLEQCEASSTVIFNIIAKKMPEEKLKNALVSSFLMSPSFSETRKRFDLLRRSVQQLSKEDLSKIKVGFHENRQLWDCENICNGSLKRYLESATDNKIRVSITGHEINVTRFI
jgi:nucleoside 2-deoxyribosyltransferase